MIPEALTEIEKLRAELDAVKAERDGLRKAMHRQYESHASIAEVLDDPTSLGIAGCKAQADKFASEAKSALSPKEAK